MIAVDTLLYEIDQRLNKVGTHSHQEIQLEDKLIALNGAQTVLIKRKIGPNNLYKIGLEGFKKRYQDLQFLVENYDAHELPLIETDKYLNKWVADIQTISPAFMFYLDSYMIADKEECTDRVIYCNPDLVKHADITLLLNNSNYKPSFEYQETFCDISTDELHYYTDGTFAPSVIYLAYIRYPKDVDKEGYIKFDGTDSINQDCELEAYLKDELLDIVYMDFGLYTENPTAVQGAQLKMQNNE